MSEYSSSNTPTPHNAATPQDGAATQYGRSFAEVYDEWYPDLNQVELAEFIASTLGQNLWICEIGVGTATVACELAARGHRVVGIDSSEDMLELAHAKCAGREWFDSTPPLLVLADASALDPASLRTLRPEGFDVVLLTNNMLFNLQSTDSQLRCLRSIAALLAPTGALIIEAYVPALQPESTKELSTRSVRPDQVVLIATETDVSNQMVSGSHIELRQGSVTLRPWSIHYQSPAQLDVLASSSGLSCTERFASASLAPFVVGESQHHVSIYRHASTALQ